MNDLKPPLGIGAIIQRTFALLFANFSTIFPMAFIPSLALAALNLAVTSLSPPPVPVEAGADAAADIAAAMPEMPGVGAVFLGVAGMVLSFFIVGFLCLVALDVVIGRRHTVAEYARQAGRHLLPVAGLGILVAIMTGIGIVFLIVPSLYVAARFLPWVEAVVFENRGWHGLGRAQDLTEGYRWPLVGAILAMGGVLLVMMMLMGATLGAVESSFVLALLVDAVFSAIYYALLAIFTALVYTRLCEIKEGRTAAEIAASIG